MPPSDAGGEPSQWLMRFAALIPPGGRVLDVAAGGGRNAQWLTARGFLVTAIDRDVVALERCEAAERIVCDLEAAPWPLTGRVFDAVLVANYLHRPLFAALCAALAPAGVLLYETFALGNAVYGRPSNPNFLLGRGELLRAFSSLRVIAFEDGDLSTRGGAAVQRICAVRVEPDALPARYPL